MMHKMISMVDITNIYNMLKISMMCLVKDFKWCLHSKDICNIFPM